MSNLCSVGTNKKEKRKKTNKMLFNTDDTTFIIHTQLELITMVFLFIFSLFEIITWDVVHSLFQLSSIFSYFYYNYTIIIVVAVFCCIRLFG